nr:hypothetical protein [Tanacetum cinerariifolium]
MNLRVVYDVLKLTPFYKAFSVTADVPEIYMQEFWENATVHHHSIRFKMNNKKRIVNLEYIREMLQICPRIPNQRFDELPFKEAVLSFLRELGHSDEIKMITDVNINKLHQPWRSFAAVINSGSGTDEGTVIIRRVPDVPTYESDDEEISWKSNDDDDNDDDQNDDDDEQTDSDNDGDDFIYPKFSTHGDEDKEEESFDPIVQTPSHDENSDDEDNDDDSHGMNVEGDKMDYEGANEVDDADKLYRDVNINLEGRDIQMADVQTTQVIEDTHVTLTSFNPKGQLQSSPVSSRFVSNMLNPSPDTGIDSIFNLNTDLTPRKDVQVSTTAELPLLSATAFPPPTTPIIPTLQQTPVPSPANVPSSSLQDLPNFGSLFGFDHRLKALEINFLEFMQTNQFTEAIASILGIIDKIIKEQVKEQVKAQVSKILPKIEKTINEQLEAETLPATHGPIQPWISNLARKDDSRTTFNELMDTPLDFLAFVINRLKVDTLIPGLLASPTYELMKGSCKSLVELEFFLKEVYKATTDN